MQTSCLPDPQTCSRVAMVCYMYRPVSCKVERARIPSSIPSDRSGVRNTYLFVCRTKVGGGYEYLGYNRTRLRYVEYIEYIGPRRQANQVVGRPFPRPRPSSNGPAGSRLSCRLGRCCVMLRLLCLKRAFSRSAIGMVREMRT